MTEPYRRSDDEDDEDADVPKDIFSITPTDYATARVQSGSFLYGMVDESDTEFDFGIQLHQDGQNLGLAAGTTYHDEEETGEKLYVYCALTPEQALDIADALEDAAKEAIEIRERTETEPDSRSLIERLMGRRSA